MIRIDWTVLPFGLAVLLAGGPLAADTKQFAGTDCSAAFSSNSWSKNNDYFQNTTTAGGIAVYCPAVRDRVGASNGPTGMISVNDPSTTDSVNCTFRAQNSTGGFVSFTAASTGVAATGDFTLSFAALTSGTGSLDSYSFRCVLPTNGRIYAYRTVENAQTD